jgi:signal transduction histidine kinase
MTAALATVLCALAASTLWGTLQTTRATDAQRHALVLDSIFSEARTAVATEEMRARQHQLEPSVAARARYMDSASAADKALSRAVELSTGPARDDALRLQAEQASYRQAADHLTVMVVEGDPGAIQQDRLRVTPAYYILQQDIDGVSRARHYEAERLVTKLRTVHTRTFAATSVGFVLGLALVAMIWRLMLAYQRRLVEHAKASSHVAALEERNRLARELHDSVSQALFSMTLHTRAMELAAQTEGLNSQNPLMRSLVQMRGLTQDALSEMRALIFQLRPDELHESGLIAAVRKHAATVTNQHGQEIHVQAPAERLPLGEWAEKELFRVVQEALNNSVKHAHAQHVDIRIFDGCERAGALVIEVADDGVGFDPRTPRQGHLGLDGMRERVEQLGGRLTIDSEAGSTLVRAVLPGILPQATSGSTGAQGSVADG